MALDEARNQADEGRGRWRPTRLEPALLNEDVVRWKLRGEELLKRSGIPYTIIRAYSPPPRPWNDPDPKDFNVAILQQADGGGVSGVITRADLGHVAAEALLRPAARGTSFEAINVGKDASAAQLAAIRTISPTFPEWKEAMGMLAKDPPVSQASETSFAAPDTGQDQGSAMTSRTPAVAAKWEGDTITLTR